MTLANIPGLAPTPGAGRTEAIIARLQMLYPRLIDLSLGRVLALLSKLGDPQLRIPPAIHVAGTNGKGSTCAFLRAMGEAAGWRVHVTISPHLVRLNERFRIAGELVTDQALADTLTRIETANAGAELTVFEALAAAAYLLFAETPADLSVIEVGLGGRFDATNVLPNPAACAITSISLDHQDFLGTDLARIAWEKAGIMKGGRPVATGLHPPEVRDVLRANATETGAWLLERGRDWSIEPTRDGLDFSDSHGTLRLPAPSLLGAHQVENAGIAVAALRASGLDTPIAALGGIATASWPARLQRLNGALANALPAHLELWLDGGHNEGAGHALATQLARWDEKPTHLIVGMKTSKDIGAFLRPLIPRAASLWAVAEPGQHLALPVRDVVAASGGVARPGPDVAGALRQIAVATEQPARILICGSLYLAGEVLKSDAVAGK